MSLINKYFEIAKQVLVLVITVVVFACADSIGDAPKDGGKRAPISATTASVSAGKVGQSTQILIQAKNNNGKNESIGGANVVITVAGTNGGIVPPVADNGDGT